MQSNGTLAPHAAALPTTFLRPKLVSLPYNSVQTLPAFRLNLDENWTFLTRDTPFKVG